LLQQFSFEQKNTRVGQLVDFATTMFATNCSRPSGGSECAQLLLIVSDGRVTSEGPDKVKQAVRRAKQSGIFMVFVIVDNPESKVRVITFKMRLVVTPDNGCALKLAFTVAQTF
jgi:midasin